VNLEQAYHGLRGSAP